MLPIWIEWDKDKFSSPMVILHLFGYWTLDFQNYTKWGFNYYLRMRWLPNLEMS
jgi:hypothetical protein